MQEIEAISGVFINGDKVLLPQRSLARRYYKGARDLIGGDILPQETPLDTLKRDAAGKLNISEVNVLANLKVAVAEKDALINRHVFICRGNYDELKVNPKNYSQADWFTKDNILAEHLTLHALTVLRVLGYLNNTP